MNWKALAWVLDRGDAEGGGAVTPTVQAIRTRVQVSVQPDPVDGWHPVIVAARSSADKYQQLADEVASELRLVYDLN
jgi:hypothetical protein